MEQKQANVQKSKSKSHKKKEEKKHKRKHDHKHKDSKSNKKHHKKEESKVYKIKPYCTYLITGRKYIAELVISMAMKGFVNIVLKIATKVMILFMMAFIQDSSVPRSWGLSINTSSRRIKMHI